MPTSLGVDLGTTQIKVCLMDETKKLILEKEKPHKAEVPVPGHSERHEQCPRKMLAILSEILSDFDLKDLAGIGVSGQMHGVVLWNSKSLINFNGESFDKIDCSRLITWMDGRCSTEFLAGLPKWSSSEKDFWGVPSRVIKLGGSNVPTGYGVASLAWLELNGQILPNWDRAGTIMDFFICFLTKHDEVLMSTQNAEGWGYANGYQWAISEEHGLINAVKLLPKIVCPEREVSTTKTHFGGIPPGAVVFCGLGDLHSSLLPVMDASDEAVIHIGTSAQVVVMFDSENIGGKVRSPTWSNTDTSHLRLMPYFGGKFLLVAASLNGGNVLSAFAKQVANWSHEMFGTPRDLQIVDGLLDSVLGVGTASSVDPPNSEVSTNSDDTSLLVNPMFYGERHCPRAGASVMNWRANTPLDSFLREIARGTITNLAQLMPEQLLDDFGISKVKLINRATQPVYAEQAKRVYKSKVISCSDEKLSAAAGAALFVLLNIGKRTTSQ